MIIQTKMIFLEDLVVLEEEGGRGGSGATGDGTDGINGTYGKQNW